MKDMSDLKPDRYIGPAQASMARNIPGVTDGRPLRKTTGVAIKCPGANRRNLMRKILVLFLIILPVSYAEAQTPSQVYEEYNNRVIAGASFEEGVLYFSKRKWAEVESAIAQSLKNSERSRSEIIEIATTASQRIEECMSISLLEEKITDDQATVIYTQKDDCNKDPSLTVADKRIIRMVSEDGWKIDEIEMTFSE